MPEPVEILFVENTTAMTPIMIWIINVTTKEYGQIIPEYNDALNDDPYNLSLYFSNVFLRLLKYNITVLNLS